MPLIHTYVYTHQSYAHYPHTRKRDTDPDRTRPVYTLITCLKLDIISVGRLSMETVMMGQVRVCVLVLMCDTCTVSSWVILNVFLYVHIYVVVYQRSNVRTSGSDNRRWGNATFNNMNCPDWDHVFSSTLSETWQRVSKRVSMTRLPKVFFQYFAQCSFHSEEHLEGVGTHLLQQQHYQDQIKNNYTVT